MSTYPEKVTLDRRAWAVTPLGNPVGTECVPVDETDGRVLARDIISKENIPPFRRSPYDGYALRAADTADASRETPVQPDRD